MNKKLIKFGEWQPIETAPLNTHVLIYGGNFKCELYGKKDITTPIIKGITGNRSCWEISDVCDTYSFWVENPTHWMPLPDVPKGKK